jgi:catechol 2,3-dioxygenase-like lactoylglutathione lyase family enzyme
LKLERVILFVKDLQRMTDFYNATLGLDLRPRRTGQDWTELEAGGATLMLHPIPAAIAQGIHVTDPPERRTDTPIKLVFQVEDVAAERTRLLARGVTMLELRPWGACDGLDPEGNVFQIAKS